MNKVILITFLIIVALYSLKLWSQSEFNEDCEYAAGGKPFITKHGSYGPHLCIVDGKIIK